MPSTKPRRRESRCFTSASGMPASIRFRMCSGRVSRRECSASTSFPEFWRACIARSSPRDLTDWSVGVRSEGYQENDCEVALLKRAYEQRLPVMLTGPTGCGKTRLVEHLGALLDRPVVTISCHDDLTSSDLVGRFLVTRGDVVWTDGPLTRAIRSGAICYLDEVVEARHDSLAILHSLTDHRRALYLDRVGQVVQAPDSFMLVCSYNPAYRSSLKDLKPSFRQRFVTVAMNYLPPDREADVLVGEAGIDRTFAQRLVQCAVSIRGADASFHIEPPSTRALVAAAKLIASGASEMDAAETCILAPLSTEGAITNGLRELAAGTLLARN
jgi:nitric oxide reductase NorQ protein